MEGWQLPIQYNRPALGGIAGCGHATRMPPAAYWPPAHWPARSELFYQICFIDLYKCAAHSGVMGSTVVVCDLCIPTSTCSGFNEWMGGGAGYLHGHLPRALADSARWPLAGRRRRRPRARTGLPLHVPWPFNIFLPRRVASHPAEMEKSSLLEKVDRCLTLG